MSFLTRTTATAFRSTRLLPRALFSTSIPTQKSAVDAARDTLKEIDRKVADAAVKGIEKGEQATEAIKSTAGIKSSKAEAEASEVTGEVKAKAQEMSAEMKGKKQEMKGEMKGKVQEMAGKAQGKASELKGEAIGKKEEIKSKM